MSASVVVGQPDFVSDPVSFPAQDKLSQGVQGGVIVGSKLIVSDQLDHRVLIFNEIPQVNGSPASIVLGQPDFVSSTCNNGGKSAHTLCHPVGLTTDSEKLIIADRNNNRVLVFNSVPSNNQADADIVIGQPDFSSNKANQGLSAPTNRTLWQPEGVFYDGDKLFIADSGNNRVLVFNDIPTENNAAADMVLGQPDFNTKDINHGGIGPSSMSYPSSVFSNQKILLVADTNNHRVIVWNSFPTYNNQPADIVIGQENFFSNSANQGSSLSGANTLKTPVYVYLKGNNIFISDLGNHRVLIFNSLPNSHNSSADAVLGQPDIDTRMVNYEGRTSRTMGQPCFSFVDGNKLYIGDEVNRRVLI